MKYVVWDCSFPRVTVGVFVGTSPPKGWNTKGKIFKNIPIQRHFGPTPIFNTMDLLFDFKRNHNLIKTLKPDGSSIFLPFKLKAIQVNN